jgi:hypothetical protein
MMKGDFSRLTFDAKKHYSAVRMQQGRVQLDADWNEQLDIHQHRLATQMTDFIGDGGVPALVDGEDNSFKITPDGDNLKIGAGRIYIAGDLYENEEEVNFTAQADYPGVTQPTGTATYLAYLDVWPRHVTPLEDADIREIALGGPDTTTRIKNLWQVKLQQVESSATPAGFDANWKPNWVEAISTGQMMARVNGRSVTLENQLYRVEIHTGGLRDQATFKWSRENGSVAAKVESIVDKTITISSAGRDPEMGFAAGQWVELRSEEQTLSGQAGTLVRLERVQENELIVVNWPANSPSSVQLVRRWDSQETNSQRGDLPLIPTLGGDGWTLLEDEIQVQFETDSEKVYKTGDYWLIPARHLTSDIEWPRDDNNEPQYQPAHGTRHHYAALALLQYNGSNWSLKANGDLRTKFNPLIGGFVNKAGDTMNGALHIQNDLRVDGHVAIGTAASNTHKLQVVGNTDLDGTLNVTGATTLAALSAQSTQLTSLTVNGDLKANKYVVQDSVDGGSSKGIFMWKADYSQWGIYMGTAGANKSLADGNAAAGAGFTSHALRLRTNDSTSNGLIVENSSEELNLSVRGSDGLTYIRGNVGIGTTSPQSKLSVSGGVAIGSSYAGSHAAPTDGLIVEGNVGIGTTDPQTPLHISKRNDTDNNLVEIARFERACDDASTAAEAEGGYIGLFVNDVDASYGSRIEAARISWRFDNADNNEKSGRLGLWTTQNETASERLTITKEGNVGIGTTSPQSKLSVSGGVAIGSSYAGSHAAPTDGLIVEGKVGIGTANPGSFKLAVNGNLSADKYVVQNEVDGGSSKGIFMWKADDSNWGIYMGQSGANKSLAGGSAVAGAGFTSHALRLRTTNSTTQGLIYENDSEELNLSVRGSDGLTYIRGNVGIGTTNPGAKLDVRGDIKFGSNGRFFPLAGLENWRIIAGRVNAAGTISYGSGFTCYKGNGTYVINIDEPFNSSNFVIIATVSMQATDTSASIFTATNGSSSFYVNINGNNSESDFCFFAMGEK